MTITAEAPFDLSWPDLPKCRTCGRPMRPPHTLASDWFGTVSRVNERNCKGCYHGGHVTISAEVARALPHSTPNRFYDPEKDQQWYADYVADRRRRGISPNGIMMPGEQAMRTNTDTGGDFCRYSHEYTPENTGHRMVRGRNYRFCLKCKAINEAARNNRRMMDRTCPQGHSLTGKNVYLDKRGYRRCRKCGAGRAAARRPVSVRKTACIHGHEFTEENTYMGNDGHRRCKTCMTEKGHTRYLAGKAAVS